MRAFTLSIPTAWMTMFVEELSLTMIISVAWSRSESEADLRCCSTPLPPTSWARLTGAGVSSATAPDSACFISS